jgi:hypothetical protein
MIEGLHFDLTYEELNTHLTVKASYHKGRALWYRARLKDLEDGGVVEDQQVSGGDPLRNLESQATKHDDRATFFDFLADHLIKDTYRLSESDLRTLELIGRYY